MSDKHCPVCFGVGWVCENHPDRHGQRSLDASAGPGCRAFAIEQTVLMSRMSAGYSKR
jgi:hypothetical protein